MAYRRDSDHGAYNHPSVCSHACREPIQQQYEGGREAVVKVVYIGILK